MPQDQTFERVKIVTTQLLQTPSPHTTYNVVFGAVSSWKRYSDFNALHSILTSDVSKPPSFFPPKTSLLDWGFGVERTDERRVALEAYLNALLECKDSKWRDHPAFIQFIGLDRLEQEIIEDAVKPAKINKRSTIKQAINVSSVSTSLQSNASKQLFATSNMPSRSFGQAQSTPSNFSTTQQLLAEQEMVIQSQDSNLDILSAVIRRQKEIGTTLGKELNAQNELLDTANERVNGLKERGKRSNRMMDKVVKG